MSSPSTAGCRSPSPTDHQRRSAGSPTRASLRAQSAGRSSGGRRWAQPAAPTAAVGTQRHFILTALPVPPGPDPPRSAPQPPSMGRPRLSVTFLKPGQVEGAGDVDGGAGAAVWPAGVHVKRAVAEEPLGGRGEADGRMPAARTPPVPRTRLSDPQPSSCDAATRSGPAGSRTRGVGLARHPPQALIPVPHPLLEGPLQHLGPAVLQRRAAQRDIPRVPPLLPFHSGPHGRPLPARRRRGTSTRDARRIRGPGRPAWLCRVRLLLSPRLVPPQPRAVSLPDPDTSGSHHRTAPHRAPQPGCPGGSAAGPGHGRAPRGSGALPPELCLPSELSVAPHPPGRAPPQPPYPTPSTSEGFPSLRTPPSQHGSPHRPPFPYRMRRLRSPGLSDASAAANGRRMRPRRFPPTPSPDGGGGRGVAPPPGAQSGPPHRERGPGGRGGNAQG